MTDETKNERRRQTHTSHLHCLECHSGTCARMACDGFYCKQTINVHTVWALQSISVTCFFRLFVCVSSCIAIQYALDSQCHGSSWQQRISPHATHKHTNRHIELDLLRSCILYNTAAGISSPVHTNKFQSRMQWQPATRRTPRILDNETPAMSILVHRNIIESNFEVYFLAFFAQHTTGIIRQS